MGRRKRKRAKAPQVAPPAPTITPPAAQGWPRWGAAGLGLSFLAVLALMGFIRPSPRLAELIEALDADDVAEAARPRAFEASRDGARAWAESFDMDVTAIRCAFVGPEGLDVDCNVLGAFSPDQPQLVTLRCERSRCLVRSIGISAMPAP